MNRILDYIKKNRLAIGITIAYFLFHFYLILHHEAWRDEAQAWVIAKNTTLPELFADLCVEGHPCLWFLLIRPFAKLGFSFYWFSLISLFLMTIACYLFFKYSPFHIITKFIILCSSLFLYINPVISRSYSLIVLLMVLICCVWKKRFERPILYGILVSLLFQTHILMVGFGIGLIIDILIEYIKNKNRKALYAFFISLGSFVLLFFELFQRSNTTNVVIVSAPFLLNSIFNKDIFRRLYVSAIKLFINFCTIGEKGAKIAAIITILIFAIEVIIIIKNNIFAYGYRILIPGVLGVMAIISISCLVYGVDMHMSACLLSIELFFCWQIFGLSMQTKYLSSFMIVFLLSLTITPTINRARIDLITYNSTSKDMSNYILTNLSEDDVVVVSQEEYFVPIYAYVSSKSSIKFWSVDTEKEYKMHKWGQNEIGYDVAQIKEIAEKYFPKNNLYYLSNKERYENEFKTDYYNNAPSYFGESYWLYKLK